MTREELIVQIKNLENQLEKKRREADELEVKYNTLVTFSNQCENRANAFYSSVSKRKTRLSLLSDLLSTVKSASKYHRRMNDALCGAEYQNTASSINYLMDSIEKQKNQVRSQTKTCDDDVNYLRNRIQQLKRELAAMPEEVTSDD